MYALRVYNEAGTMIRSEYDCKYDIKGDAIADKREWESDGCYVELIENV